MNLPAFRVVDGKLVEMGQRKEWRHVIWLPDYSQVRPITPKFVSYKLTPKERRRYARSGKPRRQARKIDELSTRWEFPTVMKPIRLLTLVRHTIAINRELSDPCVCSGRSIQAVPICFVYLPEGIEPDDRVIDLVTRWHSEKNRW